ncbi:hypothetical protein V8E36_009667 [Tilletia maclaganii]
MAHPAFQLWTVHQSMGQATVLFYVPHKTRSADLNIAIHPNHIRAGIHGQAPVLNATLWAEVQPSSSSWQIERTARKHRKSSRRHRPISQASVSPRPDTLDDGPISPRLSSGPPSTAYSIIDDPSSSQHDGFSSSSEAGSGSESEADARNSGYGSQAEDGPRPRRQLQRFDPNATRSFSSRRNLITTANAHTGLVAPAGLDPARPAGHARSALRSPAGGAEEEPAGTNEGNLASSIASLPARLRPPACRDQASQLAVPTQAPDAASRFASRTASTTSFSSLGSSSFDLAGMEGSTGPRDLGVTALSSSVGSLGSDARRANSIRAAGEIEDLSQSQDSFLSIGPLSSRGSGARLNRAHRTSSPTLSAEPTPVVEREFHDLIYHEQSSGAARPSIHPTGSQGVNPGTRSGSGSGSGSASAPSSNISGSLIMPTPNAPASSSATSTSSGISASSLTGARLVTIYLDKAQPSIWPVLISGPAPLNDEDSTLSSPDAPSATHKLPLLDERHARHSLRAALQEALDETRSAALTGLNSELRKERVHRHSGSSATGHGSIVSAASDDSDTVLGPRFSGTGSAGDGYDDDASHHQSRSGENESGVAALRQARARERQICAKYNLDATSLVLLGLHSRAHQSADRPGVASEAFHYFARAWRAALSPVATCRLVEDYLPLLDARSLSSALSSGSEADLKDNFRGTRNDAGSSASRMDRTQHSSDTLRSPTSEHAPEAGDADKARVMSEETSTMDAQREAYIAIIGGPNALGRLYLSYARLHLEVSVEKWISPLAFPSAAGHLHGPYTTGSSAVGAASPGGIVAAGGGSSPGVASGHGSGAHALDPAHGTGLGIDQARTHGWSQHAVAGAAPGSSYARSASSVPPGSRADSPGPSPGVTSETHSVLLSAAHEGEGLPHHRRPGPLAYMQAAVRLDPSLATTSADAPDVSPSRPFAFLVGESEAQAWRLPMAIEEEEWVEAHEIEAERRAVLHQEARYRSPLAGHRSANRRTSSDGSGPGAGTATPTTSSVPSSEAGVGSKYRRPPATAQPQAGEFPSTTASARRSSAPKLSSGRGPASGGGGGPSSQSRRKPHSHSRRHGHHGRSSIRRSASTLPLISEEGMINIVSGAAVLSVVVAGSVAVMGWWRRAGGATGPGL